jgi:nitroreductase
MTSPMTADEVLTTTRAVRRRLDFDRPVEPRLLRECVEAALQAPSGSNRPRMQFVIITDPELKAAVGQVYSEVYAQYRQSAGYPGRPALDEDQETQRRVAASADVLGERMGEAPVLVLGCLEGRPPEPASFMAGLGVASGIMPAMWSFMLAARARHLGTAWTSMHLQRERDVAEILGIPYDEVTQVCLTPVAHTIGTGFRPAKRPEPDAVIHWDRWS